MLYLCLGVSFLLNIHLLVFSAIVLKMARLIKDVSFRGQKAENLSKPPSKSLIIPGKEVAQVIAKVQLHFLFCNSLVY